LHGDAFALNSFLTIRLTRYVMACLPFKDGLPQGWGELMPDATRHMGHRTREDDQVFVSRE
jgi:hypothetical protein